MAGMVVTFAILLALIPSLALRADDDPVLRVGNGVSTPKVLHKVNPEYSSEAKREGIQGTALYTVIVDKGGKARDVELLSPIGYGLDEKGFEAISKWEFAPGMKDGAPVSVKATIEMSFRLEGISFDSKREEHRTSYNLAIHSMRIPERKEKSVETVRKLAAQKYPPAMSLMGQWLIDGREIPKDLPGGIDLIRKAADKNDSAGLFMLGTLYVTGEGMPVDAEKGLKMIREASTLGSQGAQFYLGRKYESVDGSIPPDPERARRYFRLCAARDIALCQFHLGRLLIPAPGRLKSDPVQALAWLELAGNGSVKEAEPLVRALREKLSALEINMAENLKPQLLRK